MNSIVGDYSISCPVCGHPCPDGGPAIVLSEIEIDTEIALLEGQFDEARCADCDSPLGITPTLVFPTTDPPGVVVYLGSLASPYADAIIRSVEEERPQTDSPCEVRRIASIEEMREVVVSQIKKRLIAIGPALASTAKPDYVLANWRELIPEVFAAAQVALTVPIAGVSISATHASGRAASAEEHAGVLAEIQAGTWVAMWYAWHSRDELCKRLETDLSWYINQSILLPGSVEKLLNILDSNGSRYPNLSFRSRYSLEAIRASLHVASKSRNPQSARWAKLFFECEMAYLDGDEALIDEMAPLIVSPIRAKASITYYDAWDAMVPFLTLPLDTRNATVLQETAEKAGYPNLLDEIISKGVHIDYDFSKGSLVDDVLDAIQTLREKEPGTHFEPPFALVEPLLKKRDIDGLERIADGLIQQYPKYPNDIERHAKIDAWLGSCLKLLREPRRFLKRIGEQPRLWEHDLSPRTKARLWLERSNSLRLLNRGAEALELLGQAIEASGEALVAEDLWTLRQNRAVLLRETGSPDLAIDELDAVLEQTDGDKRMDILESLAATWGILGEHGKVRACLDDALALARGPLKNRQTKLRAERAMLMSINGNRTEAIAELLAIRLDVAADPVALLSAGAAWANLLFNHLTDIPDNAAGAIQTVLDLLLDAYEQSATRDDVGVSLHAIATYAMITEALGWDSAEEYLTIAYETAQTYGQHPDAQVLLVLAEKAYVVQDLVRGRELLASLPNALQPTFGNLQDIARALSGSERRLSVLLGRVARSVVQNSDSFADIRLIGEMKRDVLNRSRQLGRRGPTAAVVQAFRHGITDDLIAKIAPISGNVAVLEWLDTSQETAAFVTVISPDGDVQANWLQTPKVDVSKLTGTIRRRLSNWTPGRPGDPFDVEEWMTLELWLHDSLAPWLSNNDHLIVLENRDFAGIPWHVAASSKWSCSYGSSWTSLLSLSASPDQRAIESLAVALIPMFQDHGVKETLETSAKRTASFAQDAGFTFLSEMGPTCNRDALLRILGQADLIKMLCHGYVDPKTHEVAWMISDGGALPTDAVRRPALGQFSHQFGWRDAQKVKSAPTVVFSAACSSGVNYVAGVGERLGIMAGLGPAGTRALVAPQWDVFAEDLLPILDHALELYCRTRRLANSVRSACLSAPSEIPKWLRWALTIEGDWQCERRS